MPPSMRAGCVTPAFRQGINDFSYQLILNCLYMVSFCIISLSSSSSNRNRSFSPFTRSFSMALRLGLNPNSVLPALSIRNGFDRFQSVFHTYLVLRLAVVILHFSVVRLFDDQLGLKRPKSWQNKLFANHIIPQGEPAIDKAFGWVS